MKILAAAALLLTAAPALAASPIEGNWVNPKGSVTVRIAPCGRGVWCGRVVRATAQAKADAAQGGTERLIGTELMSGLEQVDDNAWHGQVFVPDVNRTADADVRLIGPRTLDVRGCALGGLVCKSQQWRKVAGAPPAKRR